jgi:hypothetical protein
MFSDPARHAAECGPGHLGNITSDSRGWGFSAPNPPAPPKVTCLPTSQQVGSTDASLLVVQVVECCDSCECFDSCDESSRLFISENNV